MEEKTTTMRNSPAPMLGWLIAPLAILLALAAIKVAGIDFDLNLDNLMPMLLIAVAAILGSVPRIVRDNDAVKISSSALSLATLGVAMIGHQAIIHLTDQGAFTALQFLIVAFGVFFFDSRGRHEIATILTFAMIGVNVGMVAVGSYNGELDVVYQMPDDSLIDTLNLQRQALGYVFFSYLTIFVALGLLVAILARGVINPASQEGWFSKIGTHEGPYNKATLPLQIATLVWMIAHIGSLCHFDSVTMADKLGVTTVDGYHGHFGFWGAFFTGIVAMIVAGMSAEKWYTRSMFIGSMWLLYLVSSWYEAGIWQSTQLEGTWGALIWLGFTFFICVGIYMISTHEKYGGWSNRDDYEMSGARKFWNEHWSGFMVGMAFFFALVIRIQWYFVPSMNSFGTGTWDMTGGSDPWYMKRVVDYILANNAHLIFDADRSYPIGGVNPRPPLFTWSIALLSMALEPMLGEDAVWYAILGLPAIYGAFTVFPIAILAKDNFGKSAGVVAAWLIAFMPAHVSHSTWALADHDAFVMLFISMGFMFWFKAIKYSGNERLTKKSSPNISSILNSFAIVAKERRPAMAFALLAGVSFGISSLAWKGFVVGPSILFLAYFAQVALNMFRRKDSTTINALFLTMLLSNLLMALPFYGHPQMDLILNGTGLQPFLFVLGFSLVISYVTTGFRDKPWLLVLGTLFVAAVIFFSLLFVLKELELSNAWDVLFTGSGYFTKTKIFGTVAEANAPDRGQLFAQLGPIVLVLALSMGFYSIYSAFRNKSQTHLFFGIWIFAATYMSWTAARFMFNATPAVAVLGAWGIVSLWNKANWQGLVKTWKKYGIRTPADRIAGARRAVWRTPSFSAILLIVVLLGGQQFTYGLDAAIPGSDPSEDDIDADIYNLIPDALRWELAGFSILDSSSYSNNWYLGSFGSGFNDQGWNGAYDWMTQQDAQMAYSDRPAFVSWWDYGFQALDTGEHPSVSDNFQSGIPATGNMLLARSQGDLISMFIWQLSQGDISYSLSRSGDVEMTSGFANIVDNHLTGEEQFDLFTKIQEETDSDKMKQLIDEYSFTVIQTNDASQVQENSNNVMASGYHRVNGIVDDSTLYYRMYQDGERILCDPELSTSCVDGDWSDFNDANNSFNGNIRSGQETKYDTTHYIFGDYWYTNDLRDEFDSVSTHIHRHNTRLAMIVQLLGDTLSESQIVDLYDDLIGLEGYYSVQDYEGLPGSTIDRDHEIRYFAIDNRLYPRAGRYTADYSYNQGQPMGIFGAPTILSGQDIGTFMDEVYETSRGDRYFEMTREEVDEAMTNDFLDQQAGIDIDMLQVQDVRVDHSPSFFDTMLARTYVGYGASTLGVNSGDSNPQPGQHFGQSGTPNSVLQQAIPLPGAMTNHFVIANWYNEDANYTIGSANTLVKIMKYYSGAEISGTVSMSDNGNALPGVRLLIERDAFSGEGSEDLDEDTYWIPIGFTDADENGEWSYLAPAGRIRVSAYVGTFDAEPARAAINDGSFAQQINDILSLENDNRQTNAITAILGNVANMTWLGETQYNVTGEQANRTSPMNDVMDIHVESSGISGQLTWSGDELFNGEPIVETKLVLRNVDQTSENISLVTTNGSFSTEETRILQGTGQVTFDENGTFNSEGLASVIDFHGTFTRSIGEGRTYVANGSWNGTGEIKATWIDLPDSFSVNCNVDSNDSANITMPDNETVCLKDDSGDLPIYLISGLVNANGRFTSTESTLLIQEHSGSSFEGIGTFEGTGTFNGTGRFVGSGTFSGEMVSPGSFYQTGVVPGEYEAIVTINDKEIVLDDTVFIGLDPVYDQILTVSGTLLVGMITDLEGNELGNTSFTINEQSMENVMPIEITSIANGTYSYGPLTLGTYDYLIDMDGDGFNELSGSFTIDQGTESLEQNLLVPEMFDLEVEINSFVDENGDELVNSSNQLFEITDIVNESVIGFVESNETGVVEYELAPGEYQLSSVNTSEYVLFEVFKIIDEDIFVNIDYQIGSNITGQVRAFSLDYDMTWNEADKITNSVPASSVLIKVISDNLTFYTTTDIDGNFEMLLPSNLDFVLTAQNTIGNYGTGITFTPESNGMPTDLNVIYLNNTLSLDGTLYVDDNTTSWNLMYYGEYTPEVTATNLNGAYWTTDVLPNGAFSFNLEGGTYDIKVVDESLNVTPITNYLLNTTSTNQNVELFTNLESKAVTFNVFIDETGDESLENGTLVNASFTIIDQLTSQPIMNITEDNYTQQGELTVQIKPGTYTVSVNYTLASDENATDYNQFFVNKEFFVSLDNTQDNVSIAFNNQYLMTGQLLDNENNPIEDFQFLLYNESNDKWLSVNTDSSGNFSSYVDSGNWVVIIAPFESNNTTIVFRTSLDISSDDSVRTDLTLQMVEALEVRLALVENLTEVPVTESRPVLSSLDGYGNVTLIMSDQDGNISDFIMPGDWEMTFEKETDEEKWSLEQSVVISSDDSVDSILEVGNVSVSLDVLIGGRIYWDQNNPGTFDFNERIVNASIIVNGTSNYTDFSFNTTSDEDGVWSAFVPIMETYNISVSKEGFTTVYYSTEDSDGLNVTDESKQFDISSDALDVEISGTITTQLQNPELQLNNSIITLYPANDRDVEPIAINGIYANGELNWSEIVEPGDWIVYVESSNTDENGGGIAVGEITANFVDGGESQLVMETGGRIEITSSWEDIELNTYHVGDNSDGFNQIISEPEFTINIGLENTWNMSFDSDGYADLILPMGSVTITSSFETIQHERELQMNYSSTIVEQIEEGIVTEVMDYYRMRNSQVSVSIISDTLKNVSSSGVNLVTVENLDDENYKQIEFDLYIDYLGTESSDVLTIDGSAVSNFYSDNWTVEFYNGSEWVSSLNFTLGIGDNLADDSVSNFTSIKTRINLPNVSIAHSSDDGQKIRFEVTGDATFSGDAELVVLVPQMHSFEISDSTLETGASPGSPGTFSVTWENTGNGEDSFTVEIADNLPTGWSINEPMTPITVAKGAEGNYQFTATPPNDFSSGEITATVTITSEDGTTSKSYDVTIVSSKITLSVDEDLAQELTKVYESQNGQLIIPIQNSGYRTASAVSINASITNDAGTEIFEYLATQTITIPAGETVNAVFDVKPSSESFNRFAISVEIGDADADYIDESIDDFDFKEDTIIDDPEETSAWFMLVIIILTLLVAYGGLKVAKNKGSTRF